MAIFSQINRKNNQFQYKVWAKSLQGTELQTNLYQNLTVNFVFSSNILQILLIFIHKKKKKKKKNSTFVLEYTLYIIWTVSISTESRSF